MSVDEIRAALSIFLQPGQVSGILALAPDDQLIDGRQCVSFVSADLDELAKEAARRDAGGAKAVWFVPNPLRPDMARRRNVSIRAVDALARHWLLIDVDSVRALGHEDDPTSQSEKEAAWSVLDACKGTLDGYGMSGAVVGDSGNGWHLCYPILLPNDKPAWNLIRSVLKGLGDRWDTESAKLDRKTFDAARKWKMYGTTPRKGRATEERPHRPAWLVDGPPWCAERAAFNTGILEELPARWQAEADLRKGRPTGTPRERDYNYTLECARNYVAKEPPAVSGQRGHDRTFHVASILVEGFGLTAEGDFFAAIADWNQTCQPPWSEQELRHKFESAMAKVDPAKKGYLFRKVLEGGNGNGSHSRSSSAAPPPPPPEGIIIQWASEITPKQVEWLWPWRIPRGKLTTFAGQTGQGKTFAACDIASRITRGQHWPDGQFGEMTGSQVLFITGDDDIDDTLVPRFLDAGADMERVIFMTEKAQAGWTMAALGTLDKALEQAGGDVALVIIDPPTSFIRGIDDHKNSELRSILTPFKDWAKRANVAVVLITHVNKAGGQQVEAMMRVMGSVAWVTGVRTAYMFCDDPDDEGRKLFLTLKNNLGPKSRGLAYRIVAGDHVGRVEWLGEVDTTADEAMNRARHSRGHRGVVASEWLIERFRENREWLSEDLFSRARQEAVSKSAIFEAKRILDLPKPRKITAPDGSTSWIWWVPEDWPQLSQTPNSESLETLDTN